MFLSEAKYKEALILDYYYRYYLLSLSENHFWFLLLDYNFSSGIIFHFLYYNNLYSYLKNIDILALSVIILVFRASSLAIIASVIIFRFCILAIARSANDSLFGLL